MAANLLRSHIELCKVRRAQATIVFIDIKNAFYSVIRDMVVGRVNDPDDLWDVIQQVDIPLALQQPLCTMLERPSILEDAIQDSHLREMIKDAFRHTWFVRDGAPRVAIPKRGTSPSGRS